MNQQIVAHRGYAAAYPENTARSLQAAVDAGAVHLEFDIQLTRDHVPVLLHDLTFSRTAGNPASVHDLEFAELQGMDVGEFDRFGSRFEGTPVSSLAEIADWLSSWPDVTAFVELKRHSISHFGVGAVFDALLPVLQPVLEQCVIISFVDAAIEEARCRCTAPVGWVVRTWDEASRERADELQPEFLFCNVEKLPPPSQPLWPGNWDWVIYEITEARIARELGNRGVRYIETMEVAELQSALAMPAER